MTEEQVRQVMSAVGDKLPEEKKLFFKDKLLAADERKEDELMYASLHDPTHILLFSIFLGGFGVDRFLIGDTGLGIAKLLLGWATCGLWPLIDIFVSYKKAKQKNFETLMLLL